MSNEMNNKSKLAEHVDGFMEQLGTDYWVKDGGYQYSEDFPVNGKVTHIQDRTDKLFGRVKFCL